MGSEVCAWQWKNRRRTRSSPACLSVPSLCNSAAVLLTWVDAHSPGGILRNLDVLLERDDRELACRRKRALKGRGEGTLRARPSVARLGWTFQLLANKTLASRIRGVKLQSKVLKTACQVAFTLAEDPRDLGMIWPLRLRSSQGLTIEGLVPGIGEPLLHPHGRELIVGEVDCREHSHDASDIRKP
jgi:hypothetical protein